MFFRTERLICSPYEETASNFKQVYLGGTRNKLNTKMDGNGAGSGAMLGNGHLFVCQWFW